MDGNKDDASRCLRIAEDAIASGDKERALKFIKMAKRLNPSLSTDELTAACDNLDSVPSLSAKHKTVDGDKLEHGKTNEKKIYSEENVELVRNIKRNNDYYTILGLEKNCSVEEITAFFFEGNVIKEYRSFLGSSARAKLEGNVIKEYRSFLFQSCRIELQKRRWNKKMPTPHCNELHDRGFVDRQIPI